MKKDNGNREMLKALSMFTQLGVSMAACVFVGVMAGKLLDRWLGTSPWLLIVFSLIGGAASFKIMYEIVIREWM